MARELGEYRDAHLEIEGLARKSGPILESAVQALIQIHAPFFRQIGPDLRHIQTGETIEEWMPKRRKSNPNDYADWTPDDPDQLMHLYTEEAYLTPSPKTVGRLYTFMKDPVRFAALAKAWGCDTVKMLPGKRPGSDDEPKAKGGDASARSPFNPARKYDNDLDRQAEIADFIRKNGSKAAVEEARKFSSDIAGRPLRGRR